jgi:hypothetical protein
MRVWRTASACQSAPAAESRAEWDHSFPRPFGSSRMARLSRLARGRFKSSRTPVPLHEGASDAASCCRSRLCRRGCEPDAGWRWMYERLQRRMVRSSADVPLQRHSAWLAGASVRMHQ